MADCELCDNANNGNEFKIYDDDICMAILEEKPASLGHILIFPKKHHPILEQVPNIEVEHIFKIANKLSIATFESLGVHGTNILVNNGSAAHQTHSHFSVNIIPRKEKDGLNLEWKHKQLNE